ncbi:hypothetical protein [Streptomyces sp. NPDC047928]|uniref:hypothetical protein n=1 Tax=unclassified Streptomyces TaxID=2593676 RepID=UPI00371C164C
MNDLIGTLVRWGRRVLVPRPGGRHRAVGRAPSPVCFTPPSGLPGPRSPYGLDGPLDGAASALVRPYLVADERRQWRAAQRVVAW